MPDFSIVMSELSVVMPDTTRLLADSSGKTDALTSAGLGWALSRDGAVELVAVADQDRSLAEAVAEQAGTAAYGDCRQAIVESIADGLDAVFTALPPFASGQYLRLAADRGLAAFSLPPVAREYDETVELGELFAQADRPLVVARTWQFEPAYMRLADLPNLAGRVFTAQANVVQQVDKSPGWSGDARRAGGGVLLYGGYDLVDPTNLFSVALRG